MPQVPQLDKRVQPQALPGVRVNTDAPISAFGGGKSFDKVEEGIQGTFDYARKVAEEEKRKADEVQNNATTAKLDALATKLKYGENGEGGFMSQTGDLVKGLPNKVNQSWTDGLKEITDGLHTTEQRDFYNKKSQDRFNDLNRDLQSHIASENVKYDTDTTNSLVKNLINKSADNYNNPEVVGKSMAEMQMAIEGFGDRHGHSAEVKKAAVADALSEAHSGIIGRTLLGEGGKAAQDYYNFHKDQITAKDKVAIEQKIEHQVNLEKGLDIWNQVKGFRLADGSLDEKKAEQYVMNQEGITLKDKMEQRSFVNSFAAEDHQAFVRQKAADEHQFMNDVIDYRKNGKTLIEAIQFTNYSTKDNLTRENRIDTVKKMWSPPTESDPDVYINLYDKIYSGRGNQEELDEAKKRGLINVKDWSGLSKQLIRENYGGGRGADEKNVDNRIKTLIKEQVGNNAKDQNKALFAINQAASEKGMSPEQKWNYAQESFKEVGTGNYPWYKGFLFESKEAQWKQELQRADKTNTAWGFAHDQIGKDQTDAIGQGYLKSKESFTPADIDAFAKEFGGFNNIKKGTPVNNAIMSLQLRRKPVVPENIRAVLSRHPDGKY